MSLYLFSAALPLYLNRDLRYSVQTVGVLVALAAIVQVVATLGAGPLVDRRGARLALRVGAASYVAAAALYLLSRALPVIAVARVLQGIGIALVLPAVYVVIPRVVAARFRGTAIGLVGAFNNVALAIGPPLGLLLLMPNPTGLFSIALAVGALAVVLTLLLETGVPTPQPGRLLKYRGSWTPLYAVTFLSVIYWGVVTAFLPIEVPSNQVPSVGLFFAADAVAVMAARIPAGYLADRFGSRWLLVAGAAFTSAGIALLLLQPSMRTLLLSGITTGVGAALMLPPILLELTKRSDDTDRGTAMALFNTSFAAAIGVGGLAGAVLVQRLGFHPTLMLSLLCCLASIPIAASAIHAVEDH